MQIASQLATALTNQTSSNVAVAPVNGSEFHTALLAATTREETPARSTATGSAESSDKSTSAADGQSARLANVPASGAGVSATASAATAAASGANPAPGSAASASNQPAATLAGLVNGPMVQSMILPGSSQNAGQTIPAGDTAAPTVPLTRARLSAPTLSVPDKKSKVPSSSADGLAGSTTIPAAALGNIDLSSQLAGLPTPVSSVPVNIGLDVSQVPASGSAGEPGTTGLPVSFEVSPQFTAGDTAVANTTPATTDASATTDATGGNAGPASPAAAGQAQASVDSGPAATLPLALPASMPAAVSGLPAGELRAGEEAGQASPSTSTSTQRTAPSTGKRPATGNTAAPPAQSSVSSAKTTAQDAMPQMNAFGQPPRGQTQKDNVSLPATATTATGKDRGLGEVRGKRKDNASDGSAPALDATAATPAAVTAKTADAQTPMQGDANDPRSPDPAVFQKIPDGSSQILTAGSMPAPTQPGLPSTSAAPAATTPQDVPVTTAGADPAVTSSVSSAQLIQSAGQSEMRVGMRSAEFGNLSISTSVNHQVISAQISTDHSELGRALAVHLPAIEEKLGAAYGLQARVEVRDESSASRAATDSGQQGGGYQEQTGGGRGGQGRSGADTSLSSVAGGNVGSLSAAASRSSLDAPVASSRLDIRI